MHLTNFDWNSRRLTNFENANLTKKYIKLSIKTFKTLNRRFVKVLNDPKFWLNDPTPKY